VGTYRNVILKVVAGNDNTAGVDTSLANRTFERFGKSKGFGY